MTQYTKPTVLPAWAESAGGADVLQPSNVEIQAGWPLSNVPPSRKRFNWVLKYLAQGVRYILQRGMPEWDAAEDYRINDRVMGSDGKTYKCIQAGINKDPTTQTAYWTRWGFTLAELDAEGTTPAQFDNSVKRASTAFVQRALGNLQAIIASNGTIALNQTYCGQLIVGNVAGTITLPSGGATANGATIVVQAIVNGVVVARNGSDNIYFANGLTQTSIVLNKGDWTVFSWFPGYGWVAYGVIAAPSVVGTARNVKMVVTVASATATLTADEIVVSNWLGGPSYKIGSFNNTINLATTGAGGMDTGTAPASGYVALYAIYNPNTGASALLGVNASSAIVPQVYGGANMPAGYGASALVSVWPTNASSQFIIATQRDRKLQRPGVNIFNATNAAFTSVSISGVVPPNAIAVGGFFHCITNTAGGGTLDLASDANGTGLQPTGVGGITNLGVSGVFENLQVITQQTIYYRTLNMASADANVTSYII